MRSIQYNRADNRPTFGLRRSGDDSKFMVDHAPGMGRALNDMLLSGLGGHTPFSGCTRTTSARFHSFRTEGAFLVSAEKRGSEIVYAIIESETKAGAVYALERRAVPPEAIPGVS